MGSRRPISCVRQWKLLEEIRFPSRASVRTIWLLWISALFSRSIFCMSSSTNYFLSFLWWDQWVSWIFLFKPLPPNLPTPSPPYSLHKDSDVVPWSVEVQSSREGCGWRVWALEPDDLGSNPLPFLLTSYVNLGKWTSLSPSVKRGYSITYMIG